AVNKNSTSVHLLTVFKNPQLLLVYLTGFAIMYIHGVIIYEVPYLTVEKGLSTASTGKLFSIMGIGSLVTLSFFFLQRLDAIKRMMFGLFTLCISLDRKSTRLNS